MRSDITPLKSPIETGYPHGSANIFQVFDQKKGATPSDRPSNLKNYENNSRKLFNPSFGKAGSLSRTLAGFELGIGLTDYIVGAFTANNLAIGVTALGGGK